VIHEVAYAKLNLALHVRERLPDGYHRIETVFAFCEDGDVLIGQESDRLTLDLSGPFARELAAEPDNLVLRAAAMIGARVAFSLDKKLPLASGLGGGSADAAAALRLVARLRGLADEDVLGFAAALGADVPACVFSRAARGEGRGDELEPLAEELAGTPVLLVNPRRPLPTAAVFGAWDGTDRGPLGDWREGRNDLEAPALALVPEIGEVLDALSRASLARMSGSGATCFGLFESDADRDRAAAGIATAHPGWWLSQTRLR
jgi:4-diphosphocytidyl-2-C-methyl-D-erythritol kinase